MFRQLQPVSDLQRTQRFDDYDLAANRTGALSERQRWRFVQARLGEYLLGALIVAVAAAIIANALVVWLGVALSLDIIGLGAAMLLIAALVLAAIHSLRGLRSAVKFASGQVEKHEAVPVAGLALEEVTIGKAAFFVPSAVFAILDEDAIYKVYYLERSPRVGGNMLLSVEVVGSAPPDETSEA